MIVTTKVMNRMPSNMPSPRGPSLPMSQVAPAVGEFPEANTVVAVRMSGLIIKFLAAGASDGALYPEVYHALTSADGCAIPDEGSRDRFSALYCQSAEGKKRLVASLAMHKPTPDPTATLIRISVMAWVRTVGLATVELKTPQFTAAIV